MVELTRPYSRRGHAYEVDGMGYFDVSNLPTYGRLVPATPSTSLRRARSLEAGSGVRSEEAAPLGLHPGEGCRRPRLMKGATPWERAIPDGT